MLNDPIPPTVSRAIGGIQWNGVVSMTRASTGRLRSLLNAKSAAPNEPPIAAHATNPATFRLKYRIPTTPFSSAPRPGRSGMSQMNSCQF